MYGIYRLRHEIRALGRGIWGLPLLVMVIFLGVSLLAAFDAGRSGGNAAVVHGYLAKGLLFLLEFGLPPVAGLAAASLVAAHAALDIHLSLPQSYTSVMLLRLALFTGWVLLLCLLTGMLIGSAGYWIAPQSAPESALVWAAPTCWCIGIGAFLSLALRSRAASSALVGMLWLGELLFHALLLQNSVGQKLYLFLTITTIESGSGQQRAYWLTNRFSILALAVLFLLAILWLLGRNEYLLGHES